MINSLDMESRVLELFEKPTSVPDFTVINKGRYMRDASRNIRFMAHKQHRYSLSSELLRDKQYRAYS